MIHRLPRLTHLSIDSRLRLSNKFIVPALLFGLATALRLLPGPRTIDDAFITFRYARNLAEGLGFAYNPGQPVLGTTTPLYTLLLAALSPLTRGDFPILALVVNALADGLAVLVLADLGRRLTGSRLVGLAVALVWAMSPLSVTFAIGGMETSVVVLLLLGLFDAYLAGGTRLAAVLAGLALLARPDTALAVGLLFLGLTLDRRRLPWAEMALTGGVFAPWGAYALLQFGNPISNTLSAKTVAYHLAPAASFARLIQHLGVPFFEYETLADYRPVLGLALYLALAAIAVVAIARRDRRGLWVATYPAMYVAAFSLANPLIFRWYLAPPTPFYLLLILTGTWFVLRDLFQRRRAIAQIAFAGLGAAAIALTAHGWTLHPDHGPDRPAPGMAFIKLELDYAQAADWLRDHLAAGQVLAAGDIGVLGYQTGAPLLDTVGLVSPEATRYYPLPAEDYVINYAVAPGLIDDRQPDWLVMLEVYGRNTLLKDPAFESRYELVHTVDSELYGSQGMLIFHKRPLASR